MSKAVKCLLVDVDNVLISEVVEVDAELGDPNCRLVNPYRFLGEGKFEPWKSNKSKGTDDSVRRHSDYRRSHSRSC